MQSEQEAIVAQRQETQKKMAAFINAGSTSKPEASDTANSSPAKAPIEAANQQEGRDKVRFTLSTYLCAHRKRTNIEIGPWR